jgi:hypothetical protein
VVIVGWNDATAQVTSVTDSNGNVYQLAVGPTVLTGSPALSQCVYYAKNISAAAASANGVTVEFNTSAYYSDTRILEYAGADQVSPLDVSSAATGSTATASSGGVTTKDAKDLLVGPCRVDRDQWPRQRIDQANVVEDRIPTAVGSYRATGSLANAAQWIMQMVALRASGSPTPTPLSTPAPIPVSNRTFTDVERRCRDNYR